MAEPHKLTPREREVLAFMAEGLSTKEIAQLLGISVNTVSTHRSGMMAKLNIRNAVGLLRYALAHKLIEP